MKYVICALWLCASLAHADDRFLGLPDLPPGHWYSEEENKITNTVVTYQNWHQWDGWRRQNVHWRKPVRTVPKSKPAPVVPVTPEEPSVETTEKPRVELEPEGIEPKSPRSARLTPEELRKLAPLVGENYEEEKLNTPAAPTAIKVAPPALVEKRPKATTAVRWERDGHELSKEDREIIVSLLQAMTTDATRWQTDLLNRYTTCSDGKCIVRDMGIQRIEVPYQVGLGRVALLKQELQYLLYQVREEKFSRREEVAQLIQLTRRLEGLEGYLTLSEKGTASPYAERFRQKISSLSEITNEWNIFEDLDRMTWVLRWQIIALDMQVFLERAQRLDKHLSKTVKAQAQEARKALREILAETGEQPWEKSEDAQYEIAAKIFIATSELKATYKAMAKAADTNIDSGTLYGDYLALLGANENLSVYSYAIVEALAEEEKIQTQKGGNSESK